MTKAYRSWKEFKQEEYRQFGSIQLSLDELARDLYYDEKVQHWDEEPDELRFD
ncbi:MAG: hypothetical protein MUC50_13510 [Myxococcota bacterium]|nr:hypothetical protein [Myxococcota bacterium]